MAQLGDGYSTTIVFGLASNLPVQLKLWEKTVTPVGWDGGGAIPITTMRNQTYRTFVPKQLVTLSEMTFTAAYDPAMYPNVYGILNVNQTVVIQFPDGSTLLFWGYLDSVKPQENSEGNQPMVTCTVIPTMQNGGSITNRFGKTFAVIGSETGPIFTAGP